MQTKIKICGIHKEKNIECCLDNSIDMIGFVSYQKSHRNITIEKAKNICVIKSPILSIIQETFLPNPFSPINFWLIDSIAKLVCLL